MKGKKIEINLLKYGISNYIFALFSDVLIRVT
jgi:hypothetical protein